MSSALEIADAVRRGQDALQAARAAYTAAEDNPYGALIGRVSEELLRAQAEDVRRRLDAGEALPLAGVPAVIKDNLNLAGTATTCGSRMLQNYVSPYTATAVAKLQRAGAIVIGKANMDEFAMGSSSETGAFGPSLNPWDTERVAGGSSGGSAAAVAGGLVPIALGSDTGGSVRQPASFTGVYGMKPTYGRVSRYGLVAYASSLDQIGPFAQNAADLAAVLDAICGHDPQDATSVEVASDFGAALGQSVAGMRFGVITEALSGNTPGVTAALTQTVEALRLLGAQVQDVSLPTLEHAIAAYYLIAAPEASSNLARYDGMVYGLRADAPDVVSAMRQARAQGFGPEVKRRILMGTYALSSGYYDAYYSKAMKVRRLIADDFARAFEQVDVLLTPTSPFPAFKVGEKQTDPTAMYAADVDTVAVNLAGLPALSVPVALEEVEGRALPVGVQLIAPVLQDSRLLRVADALERAGAVRGRPAAWG